MNIPKLGIDLLGVAFEIYLAILFFGTFWRMKALEKRFYVMGYCGIGIILLMIQFFLNENFLIMAFVIVFFLLGFYFENSLITKVLFAFFFGVLTFSSEIMIGITQQNVLNTSIASIQENIAAYSVGVIGSKLLSLMIIQLLRLMFRPPEQQKVSKWFNLSMLFLPLQSLLIIFMIKEIATNEGYSNLLYISIMALFLSIFLIFFAVFIMNHQLKSMRYKREYESSRSRLQEQMEHANELYATGQEVKSIRHEMKQVLTAYLGLLENDKADEAAHNIRKTLSLIKATDSVISTGFPAVDAILNTMIKKASEHGIAIKHKVLVNTELYIDPFDLSLLLANALENAFEAVTKSKGIDTDIRLRITDTPGYLSILIENHTSEQVDKNLKTTKADKENHGFGIKNMKNIVAKYDGNFQADFDQATGKFTLRILLKNHEIEMG